MARIKSAKIGLPRPRVASSRTSIPGDLEYTYTSINSIVPKSLMRYRQASNEPERPKVEKRYIMPSNMFSVVDFTDLGIINEDKSRVPRFVIGENYALGGEACDGFQQKYKVYNLVGMVDEFAGAKVDSLIVKQIAGDQENIYTISKNDCAFLGIEYQTGLQLFSKNLAWKHVRDIAEFDEHNLGTSPTSIIDNTIRYVVLKLDGFTDYSDGYVLSPSGKLIKEGQFTNSIRVTTKEPVVYGNGHIVQDKKPLRVHVTHPTKKLFNHGNFISSENEVFILIQFMENHNTFTAGKSVDGCFGVDPKYFEGLDPNEYFEVSWDELGGITIEEYEEAKKKAAEEAERLAKEREEEQKRVIAEAEKAAAEQARLEALAIERMKAYKIKEVEPIEMPRFKSDIDPIVAIDIYIENLNRYFGVLDSTLDELTRDINKFKVNTPSNPLANSMNQWQNAYRSGMISNSELLDLLGEL